MLNSSVGPTTEAQLFEEIAKETVKECKKESDASKEEGGTNGPATSTETAQSSDQPNEQVRGISYFQMINELVCWLGVHFELAFPLLQSFLKNLPKNPFFCMVSLLKAEVSQDRKANVL